jgi:transcriptional regulator with XRE-family HTH domain
MFGKEFRRARLRKKVTQQELAHRANMDRGHISDLERDVKSPSLETLLRICAALGISATSLVARIERKWKNRENHSP